MNIPVLLILFRLILAPILLALAYFVGESAKMAIVVLMYLGLISDVLDGIIARKQHISTVKLRRMDSQVDMVFWLSVGFATWILFPKLIAENAIYIWMIIGMEITCYFISLVKFNKPPCVHAVLSKLWSISLVVAFTALLAFSHAGIPFVIALVLGLISQFEVIVILLFLPKWTHDIPSVYHAYLIRKGYKIKRNIYLNG
ncbi:CDP-alcohol phosphatidyltransferase family protein [Algibacter mikhailovii]|nr:CDP-alcohol phosphatidyltransferase family protein [Algibacter mikhailovii]